jgi:hypothetical protein
MNLYEVAQELSRRLTAIFLRGEDGRRPVYGHTEKFQQDRHWRDYISFFEYFHGDNGAGLGASHQTGWTGGIARIMHLFATVDAETLRELGKSAGVHVQPAAVVQDGSISEKLATVESEQSHTQPKLALC